MIYLFYGEDRLRLKEKFSRTLSLLQKKKPDAALVRVSEESWTSDTLREALASQGLFERKLIVVLDSLLSFPEAKETILSSLDEMEESSHIFLLVEDTITAPSLLKIKKITSHIEYFPSDKKLKSTPSPFSLTDAWAGGDRNRAWVLFQTMKERMEPEEIHGMFFWQAKAMLLSSASPNASSAGLNPFVFGKSKSFSKGKSKEYLTHTLSLLIDMYHNPRFRGELMLSLERFVLEN